MILALVFKMRMERLIIRKAIRDDGAAFHELHTASVTTLCRSHYPDRVIAKWIEKRSPGGYLAGIDRDEMFVCEQGGKIVGFGHAVPGEIVGIFVHPDYAAQGIGSAMVSHALHLAKQGHQGPIKLIATLNAQLFYEKLGFVTVKKFDVQRNDIAIPVAEMISKA